MRGLDAALAELAERLARVSALVVASSFQPSGLSANESFVPSRELRGMKRTHLGSVDPDPGHCAFFRLIR